ncbi:unnamed protein product [Rangifer tarandus platyrhynchus]|uniref:Uncharacterized protein n=1 Tax=Rangifer tarandus platyrhynchus TaxID=3082113 RepID=A0AC59ZWN8_RANTA
MGEPPAGPTLHPDWRSLTGIVVLGMQELPTMLATRTTNPHRPLRDSGWAGFRTTPGSSRVLPASPE